MSVAAPERVVAAAAAGAPPSFGEAVRARIGQNVYSCYQCVKCTSGCPLADQFDLTPNQVMRAVQLNDAGVLGSKAIWLCASCYTCATRCPRGIDVTGVMDALRIEARERGIAPAVPEIPQFNALFLRLTALFGRVPELALMGLFNLLRRKPLQNADLGWQLLKRGKLRLLPTFTRPARTVRPVAEPEKKVVVEVADIDEALRWAQADADVLQLEKFAPQRVAACRRLVDAARPGVKLAATGGVDASNARAYADAGADLIVSSAPYWAPPRDVKVVFALLDGACADTPSATPESPSTLVSGGPDHGNA